MRACASRHVATPLLLRALRHYAPLRYGATKREHAKEAYCFPSARARHTLLYEELMSAMLQAMMRFYSICCCSSGDGSAIEVIMLTPYLPFFFFQN